MTDERDLLVARALEDVPVPDHGEDFWDNLEARLATSQAPGSPARLGAPAARAPGDGPALRTPIVELAERRRRRSAVGMASVAAGIIFLSAVAVTLTSDEPSNRVRTVEPATSGEATTTTTATPAPSAPTPEGALIDWLEAVGAGDTDTAAALTGPRSKAYVSALTEGAGIEGFLVEAGEGYGAWADAPDRSTTEVDLDTGDEDITIVVVSGTWSGEGETGFRTDAIPVVRSGDGGWLVEAWAINPDTGGRITVDSPTAAEEGGFNGLAPDDVLSAAAPGGGTFHFSLDDQPPTSVAGEKAGGGVRATFDPPGSMSSQTHLFVIAYVDGATVSAVAGTFTVEGGRP